MTRSGARRKVLFAVAAVVSAVLAFGAVVLSPLALGLLDRTGGRDWSKLSAIGQTYGGTSAVLAALALGAVAATLVVQLRQSRSEQVSATRAFYTELVRMELEQPELYRPCWSPDASGTPDEQRQHVYVDLMVAYAHMGYETGTLTEPLLRDMMSGVFAGEPGRRYWVSARGSWHGRAAGRRSDRRFVRLVEDEYARAVAAGPVVKPVPTPPAPAVPTGSVRGGRITVAAVACAVGGLALALARRRDRR